MNKIQQYLETTNKDFMYGYLVGIRYSDGCIYDEHNGRKFELQAIDKEMVDFTAICFDKVFGRKLKVGNKSRKTTSGNIVWKVATTIKKIEDEFNLSNIENNKERQKGFVSAFYDAEGNIGKNNRFISMAGTNKNLLTNIGGYIKKLSSKRLDYNIKLTRKNHPKWKNCYKLCILKGRQGMKKHLNSNLFFELFTPQITRKIILI